MQFRFGGEWSEMHGVIDGTARLKEIFIAEEEYVKGTKLNPAQFYSKTFILQ